jgi:hypothetical protein
MHNKLVFDLSGISNRLPPFYVFLELEVQIIYNFYFVVKAFQSMIPFNVFNLSFVVI